MAKLEHAFTGDFDRALDVIEETLVELEEGKLADYEVGGQGW